MNRITFLWEKYELIFEISSVLCDFRHIDVAVHKVAEYVINSDIVIIKEVGFSKHTHTQDKQTKKNTATHTHTKVNTHR